MNGSDRNLPSGSDAAGLRPGDRLRHRWIGWLVVGIAFLLLALGRVTVFAPKLPLAEEVKTEWIGSAKQIGIALAEFDADYSYLQGPGYGAAALSWGISDGVAFRDRGRFLPPGCSGGDPASRAAAWLTSWQQHQKSTASYHPFPERP